MCRSVFTLLLILDESVTCFVSFKFLIRVLDHRIVSSQCGKPMLFHILLPSVGYFLSWFRASNYYFRNKFFFKWPSKVARELNLVLALFPILLLLLLPFNPSYWIYISTLKQFVELSSICERIVNSIRQGNSTKL